MTKDKLEARVVDLEHELTKALVALRAVRDIIGSTDEPMAERAGRARATAMLGVIDIEVFMSQQPTVVPEFLLEK